MTRCSTVMLPAFLVLLLLPAPALAEWQVRPFLGVTFGGGTTFNDFEKASGRPNVVAGVSGAFLSNVFGVEADFGHAPGFFQTGNQDFVVESSVTTVTGNLVISVPSRRLTEFTLGPYFVTGAGFMHVNFALDATVGVLPFSSTLPTMDVGGGVTGNLSQRLGLNWDARYFRSFSREQRGNSIGDEQLSFWRTIMALVIRY